MDLHLVRQYEPVLRLTQGEMFRPIAVEDYLRPARLVLCRGQDVRTLAEPGTLLLGDDRRTLHAVSPIRPINGSRPAQRDVLEITFASAWP